MKRIVLAATFGCALPLAAFGQAQGGAPDRSGAQSGVQSGARSQSETKAPGESKVPAQPAAPAQKSDSQAAAAPAPSKTPAAAPSIASVAPGVTLAAKALDVKPGHYKLDPQHGKVTWSVNHLGFSTYVGQFGTANAELTLDPKNVAATTLSARVDTGSVDAANPKLDDELKGDGWFDVKIYPQASFKATRITVTGPQTARIDGDLTLRGKTAPIVISATFNNAGIDPVDKQYTVGFDAASIIRRSTFGITQYVPFVGDNVTLRLEGEFKLQP